MLHFARPTSLALAIALLIAAPALQASGKAVEKIPAPALSSDANAPLPLEELRTFAEIMDRIKAAYVEPVDDKTLLENAIKGMLSNLDPHSAYLDPAEFAELQQSTSGEFGGLGIEVGQEEGFLKVISPIDDTPASKAGIQPGDLILKVAGHVVADVPEMLTRVAALKPGEAASLSIQRSGKLIEIQVTPGTRPVRP